MPEITGQEIGEAGNIFFKLKKNNIKVKMTATGISHYSVAEKTIHK